MRFQQSLFIDGQEYQIIENNVFLELSSIGRAVFTIKSESKPPRGVIFYDCGYTDGNYYRFFVGLVREIVKRDTRSWVIHCREISLALQLNCPISLRNCTLLDVLADISKTTRLNVSTKESADYATKLVPRFANTGNALHAIRLIGSVFDIEDVVWYQTKDGNIWIGDYQDSEWAKKQDITIPDKFFIKQQGSNMATLPAMPALRPGVRLNDFRLTEVNLQENEVHLKWNS